MYYEDRRSFNFLAGVALGAVIGAGIALLAAPQKSGKRRKRMLKTAVGRGADRWEDLSDEVRSAVRAGRRRLKLQ